MNNAIRFTALAIFILTVSGCATQQVVHVESAPIRATTRVRFEDARTSAFKVSFLLGSGNVYSCHYGISEIETGALDPDRMILLQSYLDNGVLNDNRPHTVVVKRFDIYWNRHLHMEGGAFGAVGESVSASSEVIGCKGDQEGEYFKAEVPGPNYSPIVVYLDTVIDGQDRSIRTVYPLQEDSNTKAEWPDALKAALNRTFATLGSMVATDKGSVSGGPSSN